MKTTAINLLILDDNTLIVGPLSKYLNDRFGTRINISAFFDAHKCMRQIDKKSHVIILNYFLSDEEKTRKSRFNILNSINKEHPRTDVMMISPNENIALAMWAIKKKASDYIIRCEQLLKNVLPLIDKVIVPPLKT